MSILHQSCKNISHFLRLRRHALQCQFHVFDLKFQTYLNSIPLSQAMRNQNVMGASHKVQNASQRGNFTQQVDSVFNLLMLTASHECETRFSLSLCLYGAEYNVYTDLCASFNSE